MWPAFARTSGVAVAPRNRAKAGARRHADARIVLLGAQHAIWKAVVGGHAVKLRGHLIVNS